ncbi:hypothetical protein ACOXU5_13280 [Vagococcus fluvialis]|uniref:hypothetical protein n=1 Tax=Lactobacillales TaxID=186826 RepID=UPI0010F213E6|nr:MULTISPECIES: hypothetical protein [Lactobacillales]EAE7185979.1 hypothetical protein [Listeria monocytogenes]MCJ1980484.1 hypothetical protein [Lactococcus carnosus]MDT2841001.1 hypothetical protein [Vagococcus carniphilus]HAB8995845.1 hypothetical protein [Listeria monocytogenes]
MTETDLEQQNMQLLEIKGEDREQLIQKLSLNYLKTGRYMENQMSISPTVMSNLVISSGVGLTAVSTNLSSKLFMATANPELLMKLSSGGVGSAVMESGRIVGQSGFIPVAASLPIVAPIIAMQAMNTLVIMEQFKVVNKKLDVIQKELDHILLRQEITSIADLSSAIDVVEELYDQHSTIGYFSQDMIIRLALVERDAGKLKTRYEILDSINENTASEYKNSDAYFTLLSSLLLLRIKYLRLCLDTQEHPEFIKQSTENFQNILDHTLFIYGNFRNRSKGISKKLTSSEKNINNKNPLGKLSKLKSNEPTIESIREEYISILEIENKITEDFGSAIQEMKKLQNIDNTDNSAVNLLYWQDTTGVHCIATDEDMLSLNINK